MKQIVLLASALMMLNTSLSAQTHTDSVNIDEVVVTGARIATDIRHIPFTISTINRSTIEKAQRQHLLSTLTEQVPGFFSTSRGMLGYGVSTNAAGNMSLRGIGNSPNTALLVLIDGHPQYAGLMGHPLADAYQSLSTERVEVLRGPASVLYGSNAMGGVINIVTRKQQTDTIYSSISVQGGSYGTLIADANNTIRHGKFSSHVGAGYSQTDGHRQNMDFDQLTGFAKVGYNFSQNWNASADVNITHFNSSNPGPTTKPLIDNDMHITRGETQVVAENKYANTTGAVSAFFNWGNHDIDDGYNEGGSPRAYHFKSNDKMMGISVYQSLMLIPSNRITVGFDYQRIAGEAWNDSIANHHQAPIVDKAFTDVAGYIDVRQDFATFVTANAGVRFDHHSQCGNEVIPQIGLAMHLIANAELKASVGKGFRNPTIKEMYMFPPQNPDLNPESLINYEMAYNQSILNNRLRYGINLFFIDGKDLIVTAKVDGKNKNINSGEVKNSGVEVSAAFQATQNLQFSGNYSYLHMKNPVISAPEHKLNLNAEYSIGKLWLSTSIQYVAGLYTSVLKENIQTEEFVLWNARAKYQITKCLSVFVNGENLLGQEYETYAGFPMPKATFMGGLKINL